MIVVTKDTCHMLISDACVSSILWPAGQSDYIWTNSSGQSTKLRLSDTAGAPQRAHIIVKEFFHQDAMVFEDHGTVIARCPFVDTTLTCTVLFNMSSMQVRC